MIITMMIIIMMIYSQHILLKRCGSSSVNALLKYHPKKKIYIYIYIIIYIHNNQEKLPVQQKLQSYYIIYAFCAYIINECKSSFREGKVLQGRQSICLKNVLQSLQYPLKSEQFLILTGK